MIEKLKGLKTYFAILATVVAAWASYLGDQIPLSAAVSATLAGIVAAFNRAGTQKAEDAAKAVLAAVKAAAPALFIAMFLMLPGCAISKEGRAAAHAMNVDFPVIAENVEPKDSLSDEKKAQVRELIKVFGENTQRLWVEVK